MASPHGLCYSHLFGFFFDYFSHLFGFESSEKEHMPSSTGWSFRYYSNERNLAGKSKALLLDIGNEWVQDNLINVAKKFLKLGVDGLFLADYGLFSTVSFNAPNY